jgi:hypothetical protein
VKLRLQWRLKPTDDHKYFETNLYIYVAWERDLRRKMTDGRGLGLEDWAHWLYTHLKMTGDLKDQQFMDWLFANPELEVLPVADETDPNPTDGAPSDES